MSAYTIREETVNGVRRLVVQVDGEVEITDANGQQIAFIEGNTRTLTIPAAATASLSLEDSAVTTAKLADAAVTAAKLDVPKVAVLTETHLASTFTDGEAAVGTKTMTGTVPAGAVILGTKVLVPAGFAGDTSAALIIGDGTDGDRYNTDTVDIFTTAATGVQSGVPSGDKLVTTAHQPVLTVTSAADITPVIAGAGSVTVSIYYLATV